MPEFLNYTSSLCMKIFDFVICGEFCDVEIRTKESCFHCHKVILAAASPFLRQLIGNESGKKEKLMLRMDFLSDTAIKILLRYFYTGDTVKEFVRDSEYARAVEIFCDPNCTASTLDKIADAFQTTTTTSVPEHEKIVEITRECQDILEMSKDYYEDFQMTHEFENLLEAPSTDLTSHRKKDFVLYSVEIMQDLEEESSISDKTLCHEPFSVLKVKQENPLKEKEAFPASHFPPDDTKISLNGQKAHTTQSTQEDKLNFVVKLSNIDRYNFIQRQRVKLTRTPPFLCPCENCGKIFESFQKLRSHYRHTHGEKKYKCRLCPLRFLYPKDLKCHLRTHTGEKPFICEICGKGFSQVGSMTIHKKTHKRKRQEKSKFIFYPCRDCKKQYCRKETLVSNAEHYDLSVEGLSSLICPNSNCAKKFSSTKALRKHLRNDVCNQRKLFCTTCNTEYESLILLYRHIGKIHCAHKKKQKRIKMGSSIDQDSKNSSIDLALGAELDNTVIETMVPAEALGLDQADSLLEFCTEVVMEGIDD